MIDDYCESTIFTQVDIEAEQQVDRPQEAMGEVQQEVVQHQGAMVVRLLAVEPLLEVRLFMQCYCVLKLCVS